MTRQCIQTRLSDVNIITLITIAFFILTFIIKVFTDGAFERGEVSAVVAYSKYITAAISCLFAVAGMAKRGGKVFSDEFFQLAAIFIIFCTISFIQQITTNHLSVSVYLELIKLGMPIVLAYCIVNALTSNELYGCMQAILLVSIAGYLFDLSHAGISPLDFLKSDFSKSVSPTEHSGLSGIAFVLSLYFIYFDKKKWPKYCAVLFCILTFKRLTLVAVVLAVVINVLAPKLKSNPVPDKLIAFSRGATVLLVVVWVWALLPEQEESFFSLLGRTPFDFTSGRSEILRWLLNSNFISFGYGSASIVSEQVFGVIFEMDFIRIAIELTPAAMLLFVIVFWNLGSKCLWGYYIVAYYSINLITSDSLASNFSLTLAYITIAMANEASQLNQKRERLLDVHNKKSSTQANGRDSDPSRSI